MRLLFISTTYPTPTRPHQGSFNRRLVDAWREQGHRVHVIAPVPWMERWQARNRAESLRHAQPDEHHPTFYYPPKVGRTQYHHFYRWSIRASVQRILRHETIDGVIGYWAHPDGYIAVEVAKQLEIPSLVMVGGTDVRILAQQQRRRRVITAALQRADQVVALSRDLLGCLHALGIEEERTQVLYRGVDRRLFSPGNRNEARNRLQLPIDQHLWLWVGRLCDVKHPQLFLNGLAHRKGIDSSSHAYVIGDGPLKPALIEQAERLGLAPHVTWLPSQPHQALCDWYRAANWTVLTSHSEGIPNVLLESLACGTPFIATRVGGVPEIASPDHDMLIEPNQPLALAAALDASKNESWQQRRSPRAFQPHDPLEFAQALLDRLGEDA